MAIVRRDKLGRFSIHGQQIWSEGKRLTGAARSATAKKLSRERRAPKKRKRPVPAERIKQTLPRDWQSPAKRFFEGAAGANDRKLVTVGVVVSKTQAKYVTTTNKSGTRTYVITLGDMLGKRAKALEENEIRALAEETGKTFDSVVSVVILKGKPRGRTPKKGDPIRRAIARKHLVPQRKRKRFRQKR